MVGSATSPGLIALGVVLIAAGLCVLIGFITPGASALAALITGGMAISWLPFPTHGLIDSRLPAILTACVAAALVSLGPGALSLDAKLFGRREIIIPPASQPPRSRF
jgi:uncharacterized membrane protein YphA (DoxX/SURF4 family)